MKHYARILARFKSMLWAVSPGTLEAMHEIIKDGFSESQYASFHAVEKEQYEAVVQNFGNKVKGSRISYRRGSTGILFIDGPTIPYTIDEASGNISTERIEKELSAFERDTTIRNIVFVLDTPGGAVTGTKELADKIRSVNKPTHTFVYGMSASAGYWIGSSTQNFVASQSAMIGSIGVVQRVRVDTGEGEFQVLTSKQSPYKVLRKEVPEGIEFQQKLLDDLAAIFISDVAENRNTTVEKVESDFGAGSVMSAERALTAGMIDSVMSFDDFIESLDKNPALNIAGKEETKMDLNEFLDQNPAQKAEFEKLMQSSYAKGVEDRDAQLKRVAALAGPVIKGDQYPARIKQCAISACLGETREETLNAVLTVWEATEEEKATTKAVAETEQTGDTPAERTEGNPLAENDRMIAELRSDIGLEA